MNKQLFFALSTLKVKQEVQQKTTTTRYENFMLPLCESQFLRVQLPLQVRHLPLQLLRLLILLPTNLRPLHLPLHFLHLPLQLPLHLRKLPRERLDRLHVLPLHRILFLLVRPHRLLQSLQRVISFLLVIGQLLLQAFDFPGIDCCCA